MKVGDLVRYVDDAKYFGVIIDTDPLSTMGMLHILWNDGDISWIGAWRMEAIDESG